MQLTHGNITLREDMIDYVPTYKGRVKSEPHLALIFDVTSPCGDRWINMMVIHEPTSKNPGLELTNDSRTSGVSGIQRALVLLEEWRKSKGLKSSMAGQVSGS